MTNWLVLLALFVATTSLAQRPLTISVFSEATTIPFTTFAPTPVHPGVQVGTEFDWCTGSHFRLYPAINVGYMFHRKLFQGLYGNVKIGLDLRTGAGIVFKSQLGLGYLHTFTTRQEYQLLDGQFVSDPDRGNARVMPSLNLGVGYLLRRGDLHSPELFMSYESWLEFPYSPGFIPLMSHTSIHLGAKFYPSR